MIADFIASLSWIRASALRWARERRARRPDQRLPERRQPGLGRVLVGALGLDVVGKRERRAHDHPLAEGVRQQQRQDQAGEDDAVGHEARQDHPR